MDFFVFVLSGAVLSIDCDDDSGYDDKCPDALHIRGSAQESRRFTETVIPEEFLLATLEIHQTYV
ncbi:MAG: hypothetical protein KGS49_07225 [Planctomycetes bacterium]|nr:hypothetical protein [Planctomycetota bacterium]